MSQYTALVPIKIVGGLALVYGLLLLPSILSTSPDSTSSAAGAWWFDLIPFYYIGAGLLMLFSRHRRALLSVVVMNMLLGFIFAILLIPLVLGVLSMGVLRKIFALPRY